MVCTFFGHKDAPSSIKMRLEEIIEALINEGVKNYYVGNNGNFDFYVQGVLENIVKKHNDIRFSVVLSTINETAIGTKQKYTVFPEGLENALPKFAISKRNDWMINNSQIVITYVRHNFSNSHKWLEKAKKKGLRVINLGDA